MLSLETRNPRKKNGNVVRTLIWIRPVCTWCMSDIWGQIPETVKQIEHILWGQVSETITCTKQICSIVHLHVVVSLILVQRLLRTFNYLDQWEIIVMFMLWSHMSYSLSESEVAVHSLRVLISFLRKFPNVFPLSAYANAHAYSVETADERTDHFTVHFRLWHFGKQTRGGGGAQRRRVTSKKWVIFWNSSGLPRCSIFWKFINRNLAGATL